MLKSQFQQEPKSKAPDEPAGTVYQPYQTRWHVLWSSQLALTHFSREIPIRAEANILIGSTTCFDIFYSIIACIYMIIYRSLSCRYTIDLIIHVATPGSVSIKSPYRETAMVENMIDRQISDFTRSLRMPKLSTPYHIKYHMRTHTHTHISITNLQTKDQNMQIQNFLY